MASASKPKMFLSAPLNLGFLLRLCREQVDTAKERLFLLRPEKIMPIEKLSPRPTGPSNDFNFMLKMKGA